MSDESKLNKTSKNLQKFGEKADKAGNNMMQIGCLVSLIPICILILIILFTAMNS